MPNILYLHGFNSAGNGNTAEMLRAALPGATVHSPTYPCERPLLTLAMLLAQADVLKRAPEPFIVVGTSLGAFWARTVSQQCGVPAVMVNPAVYPSTQLRRRLGMNTNFSTGVAYDFPESALAEYSEVERMPVLATKASRLVLVYENDELIEVPATCKQLAEQGETVRLLPGGQHRISAEQVPDVVAAVLELLGK
jgi:predicted esterase YcpF (UPF0227 family)